MTPAETLIEVYDKLRQEGRCTTKKEFAEMLEVNYSTLVNAMGGAPKYQSEKMAAKARSLLRENTAPAPAPPSRVEELSPAEMLRIIGGQADTIRSQQEVIARLTGAADAKKGAV